VCLCEIKRFNQEEKDAPEVRGENYFSFNHSPGVALNIEDLFKIQGCVIQGAGYEMLDLG